MIWQDIYIIVNSVKSNELAASILIKSIPYNWTIVLVVGDSDTTCIHEKVQNVLRCEVEHNSIDFTGLVCLIENEAQIKEKLGNNLPKAWLYLHDTTEFFDPDAFLNKQTYPLITSRLCGCMSMNMGIYTHKDILKIKSKIIEYKFVNQCTLQQFKAHLVNTENILFNILKVPQFMSKRSTDGFFNYPGSNVKRLKEVYIDIGLYKYKANFFQKPVYELNI